MKDTACVDFLQWALPRLKMRWPGFRKVRRQVCKRIDRRYQALGLPDVAVYRAYLEIHPEEWPVLDSLCRISISRFYRDRGVFDCLRQTVYPTLAELALARGETELRCWSIGCASGEEPYTLKLLWELDLQPRFPALTCRLITTDADPHMLQRAQKGCYPVSSLKELPSEWRETAFVRSGEEYCLREKFRTGLEFRCQDIRSRQPEETFHLVLCRNLVFTYFEGFLQQQVLPQITRRLLPGGGLVIGQTESLPDDTVSLIPWFPRLGIFRFENISLNI
jgi:chemotaxis protein methyltransferase CheR